MNSNLSREDFKTPPVCQRNLGDFEKENPENFILLWKEW